MHIVVRRCSALHTGSVASSIRPRRMLFSSEAGAARLQHKRAISNSKMVHIRHSHTERGQQMCVSREDLMAFYNYHKIDKTEDQIDKILHGPTYANQHDWLCEDLQKKYGSAPPLTRNEEIEGNGEEEYDTYKGPGGLTARQIFQRVQQGQHEGDVYWQEEQGASPLPGDNADESEQVPEDMSIKELQACFQASDIDYSDCIEKVDLIQRYKEMQR